MSTHAEILKLTDQYFSGVFNGDTELLSSLFDPAAQVYGVVDGKPYHKTAAAYIDGVGNRQSPASLGEPYRMRTMAVDVLGEIANVRLHSPQFNFDYHLYLTLAKRESGWKIVNKTFTHPSSSN